jgi:hypothetical protein
MTHQFDNYVNLFLEKHFLRNAAASAALLGSSMAANAQSPSRASMIAPNSYSVEFNLKNTPNNISSMTASLHELVKNNGEETVLKGIKILLAKDISEDKKRIVDTQNSERSYRKRFAESPNSEEDYMIKSFKEKIQDYEDEKQLNNYRLKDHILLLKTFNNVQNIAQFKNIIQDFTNIPGYVGIGLINTYFLKLTNPITIN